MVLGRDIATSYRLCNGQKKHIGFKISNSPNCVPKNACKDFM